MAHPDGDVTAEMLSEVTVIGTVSELVTVYQM